MASIIIPLYNGIEYLETCIDSVINQTVQDWEVLIGVNGFKKNSDVEIKARNISKKEISLNGEKIPLKSNIDRFYVSTHSSVSGLVEVVQMVNPKTIVLVHGNNHAQKVAKFQQLCESKLNRKLPIIQSVNEKIIEIGEMFE